MTNPILPCCLLLSTLLPRLSWDPLLPYFTVVVLLVVGVSVAIQKAPPRATVLDKVIFCGPVFIAMPMAVFSTEHFT
jgi:hypothetical protein